ncbi:MAG: hypothetical protein QXO15_11640 [Nitrososphaerota archaeon]
MREWIRHALTRRVTIRGSRGAIRIIKVEPSERIVYTVLFAVIGLICLTALQITYLIVTGSWNSEIFSAIMGLIGLIMGIFLERGEGYSG